MKMESICYIRSRIHAFKAIVLVICLIIQVSACSNRVIFIEENGLGQFESESLKIFQSINHKSIILHKALLGADTVSVISLKQHKSGKECEVTLRKINSMRILYPSMPDFKSYIILNDTICFYDRQKVYLEIEKYMKFKTKEYEKRQLDGVLAK